MGRDPDEGGIARRTALGAALAMVTAPALPSVPAPAVVAQAERTSAFLTMRERTLDILTESVRYDREAARAFLGEIMDLYLSPTYALASAPGMQLGPIMLRVALPIACRLSHARNWKDVLTPERLRTAIENKFRVIIEPEGSLAVDLGPASPGLDAEAELMARIAMQCSKEFSLVYDADQVAAIISEKTIEVLASRHREIVAAHPGEVLTTIPVRENQQIVKHIPCYLPAWMRCEERDEFLWTVDELLARYGDDEKSVAAIRAVPGVPMAPRV